MPETIVRYTFHRSGGTTGAVTGRQYHWKTRGIIMAPEGEFDHLPERAYSARVIDTRKQAQTPVPSTETPELDAEPEAHSSTYTLGEKKGGGWIPILKDGEEIDTVRGEDRAEQRLNDLRALE